MKVYSHEVTVTISDTSIEMNVYWARYLLRFGEARELFLMYLMPFEEGGVMNFLKEEKGISISTYDIHGYFKDSAYFGDTIVIEVYVEKLEKASAVLAFQTKNKKTGNILNKGTQKVVFIDVNTGKITRIPEEIRRVVKDYVAQ